MQKDFSSNTYRSTLKLFITIFTILNIVFLYYQKIFFIGNHDWDWVKGTTQVLSLNTGMFEGRYGKFILNVVLFSGQILPILNVIISLALLSAGAILITSYWQIKKEIYRLLIVLSICISPFILGWMYFPINILGNFSAVLLVAVGLIFSTKRPQKMQIFAVIFFLIALGVYPSVIEMMFICFAFRYLITKPQSYTLMLMELVPLVISVILFKVLLMLLIYTNIMYEGHYNVQTAGISEMIIRFPQTVKLSISQLITTLPFFPFRLKISGAIIFAISFISSVISSKSRFFAVTLWTGALFASVLSVFLSASPDEVAYMPRINFYGVNFLIAGSAAYLLSSTTTLRRNIGVMLSLIYILFSINQVILAQKVWQQGKIAEENLVSRISSRIEQRFQTDTLLVPVIAGELSLRQRYYPDTFQKNSPYLLEKPFVVRHIPSGMFNFYSSMPMFYGTSQISNLTPNIYQFLISATQSWPSDLSLYVDDTYAIILLTKEGISAIKSQLPR